jgi:hypothetical protein
MLMRSTGLGKAELVAEIVAVKRQGDYLVMEMRHQDLKTLLKAIARPSVLRFLLNPSSWFKTAAHPGEF